LSCAHSCGVCCAHLLCASGVFTFELHARVASVNSVEDAFNSEHSLAASALIKLNKSAL